MEETFGNPYLDDLGNDTVKILLMGLRRSGKSSIREVLFHDMKPLDTLYLESTSVPTSDNYQSLFDLSVIELPGQLNIFEPALYDYKDTFASIDVLIYVIDSQDEYITSLQNLGTIIQFAYEINPDINFEVFIHKIDGFSDDFKDDIRRDIQVRVEYETQAYGIQPNLYFQATSVYNYSIQEAVSKALQRLIPETDSLEQLLNLLLHSSDFDKAYFFDVGSKIYFAGDTMPSYDKTLEACAEYVDVVQDINRLYKDIGTPLDVVLARQDEPEVLGETRSITRLSNGSFLMFRTMIRGVALVGICSPDDSPISMSAIDHNLDICKKGLEQMWRRSKLSAIDPADGNNMTNNAANNY